MLSKKELRALAEARTKALKRAEQKIEELKKQNDMLDEYRTKLFLENFLMNKTLTQIVSTIESNNYGREAERKLDKIKELAIDGKSKTSSNKIN